MADMWASASVISEDGGYQERFDAALDAATAALAPKFAFVIEAQTKGSFTDRVDIVQRDVEKIITAATRHDPTQFAPVHEAVIGQWEVDFDAIQATRQSESQRTNNKRAWFRYQQREAAKTATALSTDRQREVDARWNQSASWNAPFETKLNNVLVGSFYDDDDYDDIQAYLVGKYGASKTATMGDEEDWSGGWARKHDDGRSEQWGSRWIPSDTQRPTEVRLYRGPRNVVRFYDSQGNQHGVEQDNVAPAFAYADSEGWDDPDSVRNFTSTGGSQKVEVVRQPLSFEAGLAKIKTTNDPVVLLQLIAYNDRLRDGGTLDAVHEASINAQDEVARVRLEALGVSTMQSKTASTWVIVPTNGDQSNTLLVIPYPQEIKKVPGFFIVRTANLGVRFYAKYSGRTFMKWHIACPTIELYNVETTVIDGAIWGTLGSRVPGVWFVRPEAAEDIGRVMGALDRFAEVADSQSVTSQVFRSRDRVAALTMVREGAVTHWAVTDEKGTDEKGEGSAPTVRDALEQAWDVLNKVLDKEPPPSDEIVQEVQQAADATDEAVQEAGGKAPTDKAADGGKPISDPKKPVVDPAKPQPEKGAPVDATGDATKKDLEAKPSAPVDDAKVDPKDVKVDPEAKDDPTDPANADTKVVPEDPPHPDVKPKADAPPADAPAADAGAKPADSELPPQIKEDGTPPASSPDSVVEKAEDQSMGDVLGLDPTKMETGERINMTYTLSDGSTGDVDVTFLREENDIYFFDGPKGEFGIGDRDGEWVDADGNSFAFAQGDAVEEITGDAAPDNGAVLEDIDLDAPADGGDVPPTEHDDDSKPDFIKSKTDEAAPPADGKDAAPADDKAPKKDDSKDDDADGKKKKKENPFAKAKASMLRENPGMSPAMADRLAKRAVSVAKTLRVTAEAMQYVIVGMDGGVPGFWSNDQGWVTDRASASLFDGSESLPQGSFVQWMPASVQSPEEFGSDFYDDVRRQGGA